MSENHWRRSRDADLLRYFQCRATMPAKFTITSLNTVRSDNGWGSPRVMTQKNSSTRRAVTRTKIFPLLGGYLLKKLWWATQQQVLHSVPIFKRGLTKAGESACKTWLDSKPNQDRVRGRKPVSRSLIFQRFCYSFIWKRQHKKAHLFQKAIL